MLLVTVEYIICNIYFLLLFKTLQVGRCQWSLLNIQGTYCETTVFVPLETPAKTEGRDLQVEEQETKHHLMKKHLRNKILKSKLQPTEKKDRNMKPGDRNTH